MWLFRILSIVALAVLGDCSVASFGTPEPVRFGAIASVVLGALAVAASWRRAPAIGAALALLGLSATVAAGGLSLSGSVDAGGAMLTGVTSGALALGVMVLALACAAAGFALVRGPIVVRAIGAIVCIAAAVPFVLAFAGASFAGAFAGPLVPLAWGASNVVLPLAALGALIVAATLAARRRAGAASAALIAGFVFAASAQLGARQAQSAGLASITAFEPLQASGVAAAGSASSGGTVASGFGGGATPVAASPLASAAASQPAALASGAIALATSSATEAPAGGPDSNSINDIVGYAQQMTVQGNNAAVSAFGGTPAAASGNATLTYGEKWHAAAAAIPKSTYDLDAFAAKLPDDAGSLFTFARDGIETEVYGGALRGGEGTYLAGAGNPTDRVLLLAELMRAKHHPVQFVHGTLAQSEIAEIVALDRNASATAPAPAPQQSAAQQSYIDDSVSQGEKQSDAIATTLAQHGAPLANAGTSPDGALLASHWWIRVPTADGKTLDLDPTLPRLQMGAHLGTADNAKPLAALPDSEFAILRIVLIARDDRGREKTLLDGPLHVADASAKALHMWFLPNDRDADPRKAATLVPHYALGEAVHDLAPLPLHNSDGSSLSEVRLEMTSTQPGHAPRTYRRWLLAPGDTADGTLGKLAGTFDMMIETGRPNAPFLVASGEEAFARGYTYLGLKTMMNGQKPFASSQLPMPISALEYYGRDGYLAQEIERRANGAVHLVYDRPQIVMERLAWDTSAPKPTGKALFDIVDNGIDVYGSGAPKANLERGIVDTKIERDISPFPPVDAYDLLTKQSESSVLRSAPTGAPGPDLGVAETVGNGGVALALAQPTTVDGVPTLAWWDVDPATGNGVGRLTGGGGQSMVEYALLVVNDALYAITIMNDLSGCAEVGGNCSGALCSAFVDTAFFVVGLKIPLSNSGNAFGALSGAAGLGAGFSVAPSFCQ